MARFILTNNENKFQKAVARNIKAGFSDYVSHNYSGLHVAAHKKKIKKIENFRETGDGDFCCIIGTCIYDEKMGTNALSSIYNDFNGDVEKIRNKALGNYLIAIKKDERITLFVDKYQILNVYYFNFAGNWFITNSLADIGSVLDTLQLDEFAFMQQTMLVGAIGNQSMFKGVFRLFGHEYIEIDSRTQTIKNKDLPYFRERRGFSGRTIESAVSEYADIVRAKFQTVANFFGKNISIHQTGGLDNRTVFAAFMSVGCKPHIMYGVGNSILSNTKNEDLFACREYQEKFDLDFYEMNWREDYIGAEYYWPELFELYGFNYSIYAASRNFFNEYEGLISPYPDFMECGYFLENLRLREFAQNRKQTQFTVEEFVENYLLVEGYGSLSKNTAFYKNRTELKKHICAILQKYMGLYKIGEGAFFSLDDFDQVRWIHSRNCDSIMVNFLNNFAPSIAMFSLPELHEFPFDVPAEWRANARFQLMLINELCPEVLEIPVFSHCLKHKLDKKTFALTPEYSLSASIAKKLRDMGVPSWIYNEIRGVYRTYFSTKNQPNAHDEEQSLKQFILPVINQNLKYLGGNISPEAYEGSFVYLMIFAQFLYGVSLLDNQRGSQS